MREARGRLIKAGEARDIFSHANVVGRESLLAYGNTKLQATCTVCITV